MAELDAELIDKLRQASILTETLAAAYGKGTKSAEMQAIAMKRLATQIQKETGLREDEAKQLAKKISEDEKRLDREEKISQQRAAAAQKFVGELINLTNSGIAATQAMYNSDKVFTAVVPTLQLLGNAVKSVSSIMSAAASGIPVLGGLVSAADKAIAVATDISIQVAQMQLENAQKYLDTFNSLTKVGVTFGGNLEDMRKAAHAGGLALDQYAKFVTSNIEGLAKMGGNLEQAANRVMQMGKSALTVNPKLLAVFGSYEEVNTALSMYASTMSMYGVDTVKNQDALNKGSADYLTTLKLLQALTGKSAEAYKADQEKRARHSAYVMKLQEIAARGPEGVKFAEALKQQVYLASQVSEAAGDYIEEKIAQSTDALAQNGEVISRNSIVFSTMNEAQSRYADGLLTNAARFGSDTESRLRANAEAGARARVEIEQENRRYIDMARVNYATQNEVVQGQNKTMAESTAALDKLGNGVDSVKQSIAQMKQPMDAGTKTTTEAIQAQVEFKKKMDILTEKSLPQMATIATQLYEFQSKLVDLFGTRLTEAVSYAIEKLTTFANKLGWASGEGTDQGPAVVGQRGVVDERQAAAINRAREARNIAGSAGYQKFRESQGYDPTGKYGTQAGPASYDAYLKSQQAVIDKAVARANKEGRSPVSKELESLLPLILDKFPGAQITSLTTGEHSETGGHYQGNAVDFTIPGYDPKRSEEYKSMLKDIGFRNVIDEYLVKTAHRSGDHIHAALAKGGVTQGPSLAGEDGPEAVIPLPDGRNIPVKMDVRELIAKLDEMINVLKDQHSTSEKILQAQA